MLMINQSSSLSHLYKPEANFEFPDGSVPQSQSGVGGGKIL